MKFQTSNQPISSFSHSSLTDIVMLLLIFFLLTSQFVIQTGVKVKLPASKTNEQAGRANLIVTITSDSGIYLGTETVSLEELSARIYQAKTATPETDLIIRADRVVGIELVIKVIDAARGAGIEKFVIETEREVL
ncbi:MAG: biopolymer transporter ExbD [Chlorobiaceae bacterium]|nr:biopolymer transporter ExbD [Chlorobiaceae bacterium]